MQLSSINRADKTIVRVFSMKYTMQQKKEDMKKEFLALSPLERIERMNAVFNDIILLKAETAGVKEYEIYKKYLKARR